MHSIGYTADKNSKKRFESYKNHNPFFLQYQEEQSKIIKLKD